MRQFKLISLCFYLRISALQAMQFSGSQHAYHASTQTEWLSLQSVPPAYYQCGFMSETWILEVRFPGSVAEKVQRSNGKYLVFLGAKKTSHLLFFWRYSFSPTQQKADLTRFCDLQVTV